MGRNGRTANGSLALLSTQLDATRLFVLGEAAAEAGAEDDDEWERVKERDMSPIAQ